MKFKAISLFLLGLSGITFSQTVIFGKQVWMTKNLNVTTFRNGDPIPQAKTDEDWLKAGENKQPAWCYYENDSALGNIYGKLYNWYAINDSRILAPVGWHVPSQMEWITLINYTGGEKFAGIHLKSNNNLKYSNEKKESYFNGILGGYRGYEGFDIESGIPKAGFIGIREFGLWWCSNEFNPARSSYMSLHKEDDEAFIDAEYRWKGLSVRCIKD
jgi:uncharacterized protein (TIGR02145 family)